MTSLYNGTSITNIERVQNNIGDSEMANSMFLQNQKINNINEVNKIWQSSDSQTITVAVTAGIIGGLFSSLFMYLTLSPYTWFISICFGFLGVLGFSLFICYISSPRSRVQAILGFNILGLLTNITSISYCIGIKNLDVLIFIFLAILSWFSGFLVLFVVSFIKQANEDLTNINVSKY